jgi:hypothetical protein
MANTKISALTSATTPLAGTEVLPIVQTGATVKVATNDLTVRNIRANATTGILQVTGPTAGTTRVATVPDANWTAARTDAAQSFTGDQTLSTGNLVQGTAAKGFNFTANTPAAGMTSQLLNWYEEGTWTTTVSSTGNITGTPTLTNGRYVRVGKQVFIQGRFSVNVTLSAVAVTFAFTHPFTKATTDWSTGLVVNDSTYALGAINNSGASASTWYFLIAATAATSGTANYQFSITYLVA